MRALLLAGSAFAVTSGTPSLAQNATWTAGTDADWNNAANWTAGVPAGTASFDGVTGNSGAITTVLFSADTTLQSMQFVAGAPQYTFDITFAGLNGLTLTGAGIVNNSSNRPLFQGDNRLTFTNASAGNAEIALGCACGLLIFNGTATAATALIRGDSEVRFNGFSTAANSTIDVTNFLRFNDNSTAGNATINGAAGFVRFFNFSNAGAATFTLDNEVSFLDDSRAQSARFFLSVNGALGFFNRSRADNAAIDNAGGFVSFRNFSSADNAVIVTRDGGFTEFRNRATGGDARFVVNGAGSLVDFSLSRGAANDGIVTAGSIEGDGQILIGDLNTLFRVGSNHESTLFSGTIDECNCGTGALEKVGIGTLILSGANTYSAGTTITAGTLQIGNGGTTGSIIGNIVNNAVLAINRSDNFDFTNNISGTGALHHTGTGTTTLTGANTYTGATNVISGTLRAGGADAFGVGSAVTVNTGAALALNNFNQTVGSLAGGGNVSLGTATLTVGNATSTVFSGTIGGSGGLVKTGTGTLILAGANTYTGGTAIDGGTLQLGNGGAFGSVLGNIVNNGILAIDRSDNFTLANLISGTGAFEQNGTGITTITGINTYTGVTTVNAGGLIVNGSIGTSRELIVNNGAFVGGSGILPSTTVRGALSPGNSIGTITINGNLTMAAGSSYVAEFGGNVSDLINVTGVAALTGNVIALPAGALLPRTYTILHADGGLSGAFTGLDRSFIPPAFRVSLTHTANDVLLTLTAGLTQFGLNRNQLAVATGIDGAANAGAALNAGFVALFNLPGAALPGALTQLSGEVATGASAAGLQLMNQYLSLLLNPFAEQRGGGAFGPAQGFASAEPLPREIADAYAAAMPVKAAPQNAMQRWSVWSAAYGGANKTQGDGAVAGSHDVAPRGYGFAVGADYRAAPGTLLGFSIAGGGTSWALGGGLGSGRSDVFQTGVYASRQFGAAYVSGALAAAWHEGSTERTVSIAGVDRLRGDFNAASLGARLEGGYRIAVRAAGLTPYAAVQAQSFRNTGFGETAASGSAQFALTYNAATATTVRAELGAWADSRIDLAGGNVLALRGRLAWAHDEGDDARIGATFQGLPGASFTVLGAAAPSDLALAGAGAELRLRNNLSLGAKFDGEFANRSQTYSGAGTVRYVW